MHRSAVQIDAGAKTDMCLYPPLILMGVGGVKKVYLAYLKTAHRSKGHGRMSVKCPCVTDLSCLNDCITSGPGSEIKIYNGHSVFKCFIYLTYQIGLTINSVCKNAVGPQN